MVDAMPGCVWGWLRPRRAAVSRAAEAGGLGKREAAEPAPRLSHQPGVHRCGINHLAFAAVARTWGELLGDNRAACDAGEEGAGFFARLRDSLGRSRRALTQELAAAAFDPGDTASWERLEEALIAGDVGVPATAELVRRLEGRPDLGDPNDALADEVAELFGEPPRIELAGEPSVILVVGVNGTGKTTTIGKLAYRLREHGHSVVVAAADTFRAAAEEQLGIWAERAGADFVEGERGGDPAAVAYDAIERARRDGRDVVVVDTAGRLHTQTNL